MKSNLKQLSSIAEFRKMRREAVNNPEHPFNSVQYQLQNRITKGRHFKEVFGADEKFSKKIDYIAAKARSCRVNRAPSITPYLACLLDEGKLDSGALEKIFVPQEFHLNIKRSEILDVYSIHEDENRNIYHDEEAGITHKYGNTLHWMVTYYCAMGCQHCYQLPFLTGSGKDAKRKRLNLGEKLDRIRAYLRRTPIVKDVLITGGDPLFLPDSDIWHILEALAGISSVKNVRFGTYAPFHLPMRITDKFVEVLSQFKERFKIEFTLHVLHPREFTPEAILATKKLDTAGFTLYSHTALMNGVNADAGTVRELIDKLYYEARVIPYYFIAFMNIPGTSGLSVKLEKLSEIVTPFLHHPNITDLEDCRNGRQCMVKLMVPTHDGKIYIYDPKQIEDLGGGEYRIRNYDGTYKKFTVA